MKFGENYILAETPCDSGWVPHGLLCYKLFQTASTYDNAKTACYNEGGRLAAPKTEPVQTLLSGLNTPAADFWVGLNDMYVNI